jgi:hypothetical protein
MYWQEGSDGSDVEAQLYLFKNTVAKKKSQARFALFLQFPPKFA